MKIHPWFRTENFPTSLSHSQLAVQCAGNRLKTVLAKTVCSKSRWCTRFLMKSSAPRCRSRGSLKRYRWRGPLSFRGKKSKKKIAKRIISFRLVVSCGKLQLRVSMSPSKKVYTTSFRSALSCFSSASKHLTELVLSHSTIQRHLHPMLDAASISTLRSIKI